MNADSRREKQSQAGESTGIETPAGFGGKAIAAPKPSGNRDVPESQPEAGSDVAPNTSALARKEFVDSVHRYIRENIQFADQKAIFFFTGATALLAFLYNGGTAKTWLKPILLWNILDVAGFIAMFGLALGVLCALMVVAPRLPGSRRGYIFWEAIAEYESPRRYADDLAQVTPASFTQSTAEHCHQLARVCRAKYRWLRASICACGLGLLASIVVFLFAGVPPHS